MKVAACGFQSRVLIDPTDKLRLILPALNQSAMSAKQRKEVGVL